MHGVIILQVRQGERDLEVRPAKTIERTQGNGLAAADAGSALYASFSHRHPQACSTLGLFNEVFLQFATDR
jgi:hypothetical protein